MDGVGLRDVQELRGHKTIAMTCRYAHLAPQHLLDAISGSDGWGSTRTGTKTGTTAVEGFANRSADYQQAAVQ